MNPDLHLRMSFSREASSLDFFELKQPLGNHFQLQFVGLSGFYQMEGASSVSAMGNVGPPPI